MILKWNQIAGLTYVVIDFTRVHNEKKPCVGGRTLCVLLSVEQIGEAGDIRVTYLVTDHESFRGSLPDNLSA